MWTFFLINFGCKVNQYEGEALREAWIKLGGKECALPDEAQWIVLNTCAVTADALRQVRQSVRHLHKLSPKAKIIIIGCSASAAKKECSVLPGVVRVIAQAEKESLLSGPENFIHSEITDTDKNKNFPDFSLSTSKRSRAILKVQDGCSCKCAYCIVPLTRGPARSRSISEIIAEAERLLDSGHREIMLSGVNLRQYYADGLDFWDMIQVLEKKLADKWQGVARFRLSSLDPGQLNTKALSTLGAARLICPHLHISLQSASISVLRRMKRGHYLPKNILSFVDNLRHIWPKFGLGVDVLMGFPEEKEEDVQDTLNFLEALPLSYAHVFPFSARPKTAAAVMKDLPGQIKKDRAARARKVAEKKQAAFLQNLLTEKKFLVAFDHYPKEEKGLHAKKIRGKNEYYVSCMPYDEKNIYAPEKQNKPGLVSVRPIAVKDSHLLVQKIEA